ncbi:uncharacterized protein LOC116948749 isoform X3 [Petromyzon marinus]|uniref:uncharacterized protein LOC116948749 isoform X3 n=1 Tax=Petromyzon marinus TaxID=7757 RepID=UPI003F70ED18
MRCSVTTGGHRHRHLCKGAAYENDSNSCSCCLNQPVPSAKRVARAMTDPSATMDGKSIDADGVENDPKSPKKIQFEMPSFQTYLDPASSEQIRRRRPTPASLILLSDQSSPEEEQTSCVTGINYLAQTSQPRPLSVFNPPTRKELQELVRFSMARDGRESEISSPEDTSTSPTNGSLPSGNGGDTDHHGRDEAGKKTSSGETQEAVRAGSETAPEENAHGGKPLQDCRMDNSSSERS